METATAISNDHAAKCTLVRLLHAHALALCDHLVPLSPSISIRSRPNRHRLRSPWTSSRRSSSITDDIPPKADPITQSPGTVPQLSRHASDPTLQHARISLRPALSSSPIIPANASMQGETTITFTQPGVEPPVYMVTSLSTPPWAPLEMKPSKEKTPSGDFVFEQTFGNVAEGSYQYKIRVGEGHWVIDESKETGMS